eukprot:TRINITY_DN6380_c0_g1_i2.p1 TRINITY_DN6380_c0_g1~~TRINITY_DN6380_c0_g1_i2.p1  ORF type:complete len:327 (+),score=68.21 TRINITY_DN6380_c0_g1_i2:220-1200(+)
MSLQRVSQLPNLHRSISDAFRPAALTAQHHWQRWLRGYPYAVNFHFTRKCNYNCHFCFHTAISSKTPSFEDARTVLEQFYAQGMNKLNIAGGEPLLYKNYVSDIVKFAKLDLGITTSIVSNASRIQERWLQEHAHLIDYFAISCDSDNDELNAKMGRRERGKTYSEQTARTLRAAQLCHDLGINLKINTVVLSDNHAIDMSDFIRQLRPMRWKVFQVLVLDNENSGNGTLRNARNLRVTDAQFDAFIARHQDVCAEANIRLVPEPNRLMQNSYILLDEELRLLNCSDGAKKPGRSVLEIGVIQAMQEAGFDKQAFQARDGTYYGQG